MFFFFFFFNAEVDMENDAELKYLKEGDGKRKSTLWELTLVPFKEAKEVILLGFFLIKSCPP